MPGAKTGMVGGMETGDAWGSKANLLRGSMLYCVLIVPEATH